MESGRCTADILDLLLRNKVYFLASKPQDSEEFLFLLNKIPSDKNCHCRQDWKGAKK